MPRVLKKQDLRRLLEENLHMDLPQILAKLKPGIGRYRAAREITALTGGTIVVKPSTLWLMVQKANEAGEIHFGFHSEWGGRHFGRRIYHKLATVNYVCRVTNCSYRKVEERDLRDNIYFGLRGMKCPKCQRRGTYQASFVYNEQKYRKAVIEVDGYDRECFIGKEYHPVSKEEEKIIYEHIIIR